MLRGAVAAAIAGTGWIGLFYLGSRFDPGPWFLIPVLAWGMFGPSLAGWLAVGRRSRDMIRPSLAAAFIPGVIFALFTVGRSELWFVTFVMIAAVCAIGATVAWCVGSMLQGLAEDPATRSTNLP